FLFNAPSDSEISTLSLHDALPILAGKMMEKDIFHEPFRAKLIPNYTTIKEQAKKQGAYGTIISGAGPVMISFVPKTQTDKVVAHMKRLLPDYEVTQLQVDESGLQIT